MHAKIVDRYFDTQLAINDCTFNELLFTLYEAGLFNITLANPKLLTTSNLRLLLGKGIVNTFGANQPCTMQVWPSGGFAPNITKNFESVSYSRGNNFAIDTPFSADIKCLNTSTGDFEQATTLDLEFKAQFNFNVSYSVLLKFEVYEMTLKLVDTVDTNISISSNFVINKKLAFALSIINGYIETIFNGGSACPTSLPALLCAG